MDWSPIESAAPPPHHGREIFRTRVREAVPGGLISLVALVDMAQDAAARHAANFAMGYDDPLPDGAVWVLGRLRCVTRRYPRLGQRVAVETWPAGLERRRARRAFRFATDEDGVIAAALSAWSLFSLEQRRPLGRIDAVFEAVPAAGPALVDFLPTVRTGADRALGSVQARPADIDVFGHVNNAHLVAFTLGGLAAEIAEPFQPADFDIAFRAECRADDVFDIRGAHEGDWRLRLTRRADGIDVVRARVRHRG